MFLDAQRTNSHVDSSILHDQNLSDCCDDLDDNEELVIAEMLEHINLPVLNFSSVNLIKLLHEHECVEEKCTMLQQLWMVTDNICHVYCSHHYWNIEDKVALKHNEKKNTYLVDGDGDDVSDHCACD